MVAKLSSPTGKKVTYRSPTNGAVSIASDITLVTVGGQSRDEVYDYFNPFYRSSILGN